MNASRDSSANSYQVTPERNSQRATGRNQWRQALTIGRGEMDPIYGTFCPIYGL
jgi:hypothetical protein